jgi:ribose transport system ATP-binding protein
VTEQSTVVVEQATMVLSGISKSFGGVEALRDVSLEVRSGQVHALLGENGAGKSTLMAIASGAIRPDDGTITFLGRQLTHLTPSLATELGIAIVHQHPALMPDLTVADNLRVAIPPRYLRFGGDEEASMRELLASVGSTAHLKDRVGSLTVAQKHLLELAKALAIKPKLLILDEPTAPLGQEAVDLLFDRVRSAAGEGTAVVYITHRLVEVQILADHVTVLRDGKLSGSAPVSEMTDDTMLAMIVGRQLDSTFPAKHVLKPGDDAALIVDGLSGNGFSGISMLANRGEIIGVAGAVGNGQSNLLRALAGLASFSGAVSLGGTPCGQAQLRDRAAYMPADRHREGLMMTLTVRENSALSSLPRFARGPLLSRKTEVEVVTRQLDELAVKTPSIEAPVTALSGGNQQKVVLSRVLLADPAVLVADEPTQGVDVGARAEIYRILREVCDRGVPVVVASSDAKELEGLCDRVIVMSRGHIVETLSGDEITEERMIRAAVRSTAHTRQASGETGARAERWAAVRRFIQGDYAPVVILGIVMLALAGYIYGRNNLYFSAFNITSAMLAAAALGFIAMGQTVALLTGGIDLSVGPLAGFLVVLASFFVNDGKSGLTMALGFLLMVIAAAGIGTINGTLIRFVKFTPVAATLVTYLGLQGLSFLLRSVPGGYMSGSVVNVITYKVGPVPIAFVLLVIATAAMEFLLRARRWGRSLRAVGSDEESARRVGVRNSRTIIGAYVLTSLFIFLGAVMLLAQLGVGDPSQGIGYTLSSITAVVLGGTSLLGGRGSFAGTLLGAGLVVQVLNATIFLGLSQTWQYFFQGALMVVAAVLYWQVRRVRVAVVS